MATCNVLRFLRKGNKLLPASICARSSAQHECEYQPIGSQQFHSSAVNNVDHRKDRAVVKHLYYTDHEKTLSHAYNPLVELPDYTYQDGRPTELSLSHRERQARNYDLAKQVVKLVGEMEMAQSEKRVQDEAANKYRTNRRKAQLREKGGSSSNNKS